MAKSESGYYFVRLDEDMLLDTKIRKLRRTKGYEGVGVYLSLLTLFRRYEEHGYCIPMDSLEEIAEEDMFVPIDTLRSIVEICLEIGLFELNEEMKFFSPRLRNTLFKQEQTREKQRMAAEETNRRRGLALERNAIA